LNNPAQRRVYTRGQKGKEKDMKNIIGIVNPAHIIKFSAGFGIPADFWIANEKAFLRIRVET
jgi:hypothetical protein